MKNLLYISFLIILVLSCKNSKDIGFSEENTVITDMVSTETISEFKADTLTKISEPFALNKMLCYWEHFFVIYDYGFADITMKLKDYKTKEILLKIEYSPKYIEYYNYKSESYFDTINKKHFKDFNFDGYKDFYIYYYGSMPMTSATGIYFFDVQTKTFVSKTDADGEDLSDTNIDEIDSLNRILTTSSFDMERVYRRKHHFAKNGKIKFSEYITESTIEISDTLYDIIDYSKIINGEKIERRIDTLKWD